MRVPAFLTSTFLSSASLCTAAALVVAACAPHETHALAPPTEEQAKLAQTFMEGTMEPAAEDVWNAVGFIVDYEGEHDLSPKNDAEWSAVIDHVDTLELVLEGLKNASFAWDEATWGGYVDHVIEAVEANRHAAEAHDVDAMFEAGELLDEACESCHLHFEEGETGVSQSPPAPL